MQEKEYYSVEDIMKTFGKTRTTVLAWANDNSLKGYKSEKQGKSWFFRKINGDDAIETEGNPKDKEEIVRLNGEVERLNGELSELKRNHQDAINELKTKHINDLNEANSKNDKTRQGLEAQREKFEGWAKEERVNIEKEREDRLGGVAEREAEVESREIKLNEKEAKILELKIKTDEQAEVNKGLQADLAEQLSIVEEERERLEKIAPETEKEARENLERILTHLKKGAIGFIEQALYQMTMPFVERAWVSFKCPDCHKDGSDGIKREAYFDIPLLRDCPPSYGFGVCYDCDLDQVNNRNLPAFLCEVCPTENRMLAASEFLIEALTMAGIEIEFDADGQYKPTSYVDEKDRQLSVKQQVDRLMDKFRPLIEAKKIERAKGEGGETEEAIEPESEDKNLGAIESQAPEGLEKGKKPFPSEDLEDE